MSRHNWVTTYSPVFAGQSRFEEPEDHWLALQQRLNRWGGGQNIERLEQLGQIARTDQNE